QLFLKAQRQRQLAPPSPAIAELLRDLEMVVAITHRAHRRLTDATVEMDRRQSEQLRHTLDRALHELGRLAAKIPPEEAPPPSPQEEAHVEPKSTHHDSGTAGPGSEPTRDRAGAQPLPSVGAQGPAVELRPGPDTTPSRESRTLSVPDPGTVDHLQGESGAGAGGTGGLRRDPLLPDADRLLSSSRDRATAPRAGGTLRLPARPGTPARHVSAPGS